MKMYYLFGDKSKQRKIVWHQVKGGILIEDDDCFIRPRALIRAYSIRGIPDRYRHSD